MVWLGLALALGSLAARAVGEPPEQRAAAFAAEPDNALRDEPWLSLERPASVAGAAPAAVEPRPLERRAQTVTARAAGTQAPRRGSAAWLRTTVSLGGVVGLILLLAWGYRRMAAGGRLGLSLRPRRAGVVEVLSRTTLAPRQSLCLVRVGPRLVLLGCTPTSIQPLDVICDADLTARLAGQAAQQRPDSHTAEFTRVLESEARNFEPEAAPADELAAPTDARLNALRDTLGDTIQRVRAKLAGA